MGTSWLEAWHKYQKDSAARGVGMIFADIMLHHRVHYWNIVAGVNHRGVPGFGACGVHIFDSQVIEDLYQVRAVFPRLFPADECDKHVSAKKDTTERCAPPPLILDCHFIELYT